MLLAADFSSSLKSSKDENPRAHRFLKAIRFLFLAALILICVGGGLSGDGPGVLQARVPAQVGYVIPVIVLVLATIMLLHLGSQKHRIVSSKAVVSGDLFIRILKR